VGAPLGSAAIDPGTSPSVSVEKLTVNGLDGA
jgi:hypothetical protein